MGHYFFDTQLIIYTYFSISVETCGQPRIANMMENITVKPGDKAEFNCKVTSLFLIP